MDVITADELWLPHPLRQSGRFGHNIIRTKKRPECYDKQHERFGVGQAVKKVAVTGAGL